MPHILRFCLLVLFLSLAGESMGQNFYVIAARGNVKSKTKGKNLRSGDIIPLTDEVTFSEASDLLSLMTDEGARFVVAYPGKRFKKRKSQFPLQEVKLPGAPATFPVDPVLASIEDAKLFFSTRPFVFLGPDSRLKVNKKVFPLSRALFFYMNYDFKDDNIDKKIDFKGDTLIMIKRNLFKIDGKEVDGKFAENFKFYYYNQPKNKHHFLGKMTPYFPVDERLKEETDVIVTRMQQSNATPEAIVNELGGFILQHYGTVISGDFTQWIMEIYPALAPGASKAYAQAKAKSDAAAAAAAALNTAKPVEEEEKPSKGAKKP
jgi:hypothetical protein